MNYQELRSLYKKLTKFDDEIITDKFLKAELFSKEHEKYLEVEMGILAIKKELRHLMEEKENG